MHRAQEPFGLLLSIQPQFRPNGHSSYIFCSFQANSRPTDTIYTYSLQTLFILQEQKLELNSGLKFSRKQSSSSNAMDAEKLQQQFSEGEGESDSPGGRSGQESWDSDISADEEDLIIRLHKLLGDRWALIAGRLPWRTTEEIEKYWKMRSQETDQSSD